MIARPLLLGFLATAMAGAQDVPLEVPQETPRAIQVTEPPAAAKSLTSDLVISNTRQFRINGGETADRAAVAVLAEEAKTELLRLTEEKDDWKVLISITLHGKAGDPMPARSLATRLFVSEVGFEVHLDAHLARGIEADRFKFAVTSALIYERTLRTRATSDSDTPYNVPAWLAEGLLEATDWRLDQSDRRLYEALFKTGGIFKIDEIFTMSETGFDDLDGAMRAAFRVSSGALVMALLQQPQGKGGFRAFLSDVADFQGETPALLRKHFPELNLSETSLAKWWALQLANIGGQNLASDILTVSQTETQLNDALRLNFRTADGIIQQKELGAWPEIASLPAPERVNSVRLAQDALVRLSYRCFPSYRPLLAEYQVVIASIAKNETKMVADQLTKLGERRATMTARALQARDYLDWFEITRARAGEVSGGFDDYMRLKDRLKSNPHRRDDDLSRYLDRLDVIFSRAIDPKGDPQQGGELFPDLPPLPPLPPMQGN